jgi:hypothetical protein
MREQKPRNSKSNWNESHSARRSPSSLGAPQNGRSSWRRSMSWPRATSTPNSALPSGGRSGAGAAAGAGPRPRSDQRGRAAQGVRRRPDCPTAVAFSGDQGVGVVARLVTEQQRGADLPATRDHDLEPAVGPAQPGRTADVQPPVRSWCWSSNSTVPPWWIRGGLRLVQGAGGCSQPVRMRPLAHSDANSRASIIRITRLRSSSAPKPRQYGRVEREMCRTRWVARRGQSPLSLRCGDLEVACDVDATLERVEHDAGSLDGGEQ